MPCPDKAGHVDYAEEEGVPAGWAESIDVVDLGVVGVEAVARCVV